VDKQEAQARLQARLEEIRPYVTPVEPSQRARLFEMLADLTDEDGAYTELEDLEDLGLGYFDEGPEQP
jgi:hypothetical protein